MPRITPFLWFDNNAEEAVTFYASVFPNCTITGVNRVGGGQVMLVNFELDGVQYMALNGGTHYQLSPAFSLFVSCTSQEEVDDYWDKLTADGGQESQCGWLVDKFGVSWQIIPAALMELMSDPDQEKAGRVMQAMLQMVKIDIAKLQAAYEGR